MARPDKQTDKQDDSQADPNPESSSGEDARDDADGYKPTRRQAARDADTPRSTKPGGKPGESRKGPPPSKLQQFMDDHWSQWLSQVLLIALLAFGYIGWKLEYLREGMIGLVLAGGMLAMAIYGTAGPAYDLIVSKSGRTLFAVLAIVWAAAVGYPTLRKAVPRKVLAEAVLTEQNKSMKLPIGENSSGPFDATVSATIKSEAGDRKVDYTVTLTGDNNQSSELSGLFEVRVNQTRGRRGSTHWTQQVNQFEHRLPSSLRGRELTVATEQVDEVLQSGLHVAIHPQSMNPMWFLIAGIFVVLGMIFVEARVGDAKTKTHLIMASATTLVFAWHFSQNANPNRLVAPALDSLFLALVTGGIGGTLVGAVVRRVSGRDKLKPKTAEDLEEDKSTE